MTYVVSRFDVVLQRDSNFIDRLPNGEVLKTDRLPA